ncbi:right-handed parallel beta-helix repeat-containing protein [Luteimonas sp. RD2P54]|uniref:Right-handed parallel beta-helix repeat-containing protein n=1 Tax=Luteimonas endophytica TaxID=3042023 RepID=A0ABT6J9Q5_9GAMM|nr:right-handed parallel beta-helix repeat-containing protein [Luteimonas endophytica]MDH5823557.1 right-handed parallel beta-helix repeat-containing protein [Luteimonas endophytica]
MGKGILLFAMLLATGIAQAAPYKLFLSATGHDSNSGLTPAASIRTLQRANQLLESASPATPVEIHIAQGVYHDQQVDWTFTNGQLITFTPINFTNDRPVFEGNGAALWFNYRGTDGTSRLNFRYLRVQNYNTAMSFSGNRNDINAWNGGNKIQGMYFYNIGGVYSIGGYSTAALRLVNSRNNHIVNNHFVNVLNHAGDGAHIHAIYAAHHSSSNLIERNKFVNSNGDPIRIRDASDFNQILDNRFFDTGLGAFYSDWYCTHDRTDCTKPTPECPSIGNEFRYNELNDGYEGWISVFKLYGPDNACGVLAQPRLRTSGNYRPEPPAPPGPPVEPCPPPDPDTLCQ